MRLQGALFPALHMRSITKMDFNRCSSIAITTCGNCMCKIKSTVIAMHISLYLFLVARIRNLCQCAQLLKESSVFFLVCSGGTNRRLDFLQSLIRERGSKASRK